MCLPMICMLLQGMRMESLVRLREDAPAGHTAHREIRVGCQQGALRYDFEQRVRQEEAEGGPVDDKDCMRLPQDPQC